MEDLQIDGRIFLYKSGIGTNRWVCVWYMLERTTNTRYDDNDDDNDDYGDTDELWTPDSYDAWPSNQKKK